MTKHYELGKSLTTPGIKIKERNALVVILECFQATIRNPRSNITDAINGPRKISIMLEPRP